MDHYIEYKKKRCKKLVLHITPTTDFQNILSKLNDVRFHGFSLTNEQIIYAVLELLNNSLRAHRENDQSQTIYLSFSTDDRGMEIFLQDWGGGFDTARLPYDLNEDVREINIHDENFERYREKHQHKRFGLGLFLAKKTFHEFSLYFVDDGGMETTWHNGNCAGTVIRLRTEYLRAVHSKEVHYGEPAYR